METIVDARPYQLLCAFCLKGGAALDGVRKSAAERLLSLAGADDKTPVRLRCHADGVYRYQNPGRGEDTPEGPLFNEKRDLDILRKLGLTPGDTRPVGELLDRVASRIPDNQGICGYGAAAKSAAWKGCPLADSAYYRKGLDAKESVLPPRPATECREFKTRTAAEIQTAPVLKVRPHHLLCVVCFTGRQLPLGPIEADNLYEIAERIWTNPAIEVELVRGCCSICPPCPRYEAATGLCVGGNGMSLRDQKKDLDVLWRLDLSYGDRVPGGELYARLFAEIQSTMEICGYGDGNATAYEWSVCGSCLKGVYGKGREIFNEHMNKRKPKERTSGL